MQVILAQHAGACYGVRRALAAAEEVLAKGGEVYTLGPLIHNPKVVADLESRGAKVVDSVDAVQGATVLIRSHGVAPDVREALHRRADSVVDATCPHVARAQEAAFQLASSGCRVLVVGETGHPEVKGLCACAHKAGGRVDTVSKPDDIAEDICDPVGVVVQTTQMRENLDAVLARLKELGVHPVVKNTICSATSQRQATAQAVACKADAMVVIGGRNSSNTTRLAEICAHACRKVYHIEDASELDAAHFSDCASVGVTAGASTPEDQIAAVVGFLENLP